MNEGIATVMNSGQPWAMERAQYAIDVHNAVGAGQLSPSEAKEILQDLVSTQKLDEASSDMQLRAALVFGVMQIVSLYG
jgi:polyhydroxyalkanoate synthesis regulator phasin